MSTAENTVEKTAVALEKPKAVSKVSTSSATSRAMALKPRMSEKTYAQSHATNTYAFDVPKTANKIEVARAVAEQFKVTVEDVRIAIIKGKEARSIRIGGTRKMISGKRVNIKKAYVRVKQGETIPIFASIDEAEEKAKKAEAKAAKKSDSTKSSTAVVKAKPKKKITKKENTEVEEKKEEILKPKSRFSFRRGNK